MKKIIKKYIKKIISKLFLLRMKNKATIIGNVDFSYTSKIIIGNGSNKSDIVLNDRCRMYASLISRFGGKITLEENVKIGYGTLVGCINSVIIKKGTAIAHNVVIFDSNSHPLNPEDRKIMYESPWDSPLRNWNYSISKPIEIGENVWIGSGVRINKGVTIGDNSIIAANAVVTKDVPINSIAAGNPANIVKKDIQNEPRLIKLSNE